VVFFVSKIKVHTRRSRDSICHPAQPSTLVIPTFGPTVGQGPSHSRRSLLKLPKKETGVGRTNHRQQRNRCSAMVKHAVPCSASRGMWALSWESLGQRACRESSSIHAGTLKRRVKKCKKLEWIPWEPPTRYVYTVTVFYNMIVGIFPRFVPTMTCSLRLRVKRDLIPALIEGNQSRKQAAYSYGYMLKEKTTC
jgi:hypothetical protein